MSAWQNIGVQPGPAADYPRAWSYWSFRVVVAAGVSVACLLGAARVWAGGAPLGSGTQDFYVAPSGSDGNSGTTPLAPFATIQHARDVVRAQIAGGMTQDVTVNLGPGNYFIDGQPVVFDDRDGGSNGYTVTYRGAADLATRVYGGRPITNWTQVTATQYAATVPDLQQHFTLYENDEAANGGYYHEFADVDAGNWSASGTTLTYNPRNLPITNQVVVLGTVQDVFVVMGRSTQQIVANLVFEGLHMIGSDYTNAWPGGEVDFPGYTGIYDGIPCTNTPLGVIFPEARHGQFFLQNAKNVVIRNSKLYGAGFMAAFFNRWAQSNRVENCWIENTGRDGLYFQGWEAGRGATDGITTLAASYCNKFNVVSNNVIHDIGRFGGSMGIRCDFSGDNRLEHNIINGVSGGAYHGHGWRAQMINILYHYVIHGFPASGIPYPYAQTNITFYSDGYVVTEANQGAGVNHCRNNLVRYNDVSQAPREGADTGMITQWGAGTSNVWACNAIHDSSAISWDIYFHPLYNDDGSHQTTIKGNIVYWIAGGGETAGVMEKGNFVSCTENILADCVMPPGGAIIGPFCEEANRMVWATNIVAAEVGTPFSGGAGSQTPVQAVKSGYMIVGATDSDANIASMCGTNANVAYPILQTCRNNLYYYQPLDRSASSSPGAANLQAAVNGNQSFDTNSIYADPLFNRQRPWWDARCTDYGLRTNSPALSRGFQQTDASLIGLQPGFPFNVTNILGQSAAKIRFAADYSRLLNVHASGDRIQPISGAAMPAGSWVRYNYVDFGAGECEQFLAHLQWASAPTNKGSAIEIRLDAPDGTLIGTVPYGQVTCRIAATAGTHSLFLVFPSVNVRSLDWFIFTPRLVWTGDGSDNLWSTAANWSGTLADGVPLYFGASPRTAPTNDLSAGFTCAGLAFDADAPAYTLAGSGIALTGDLVNGSTNDQIVNLPIVLSGAGPIRVDTGAHGLSLGGGLSGSSGGLTKDGAGTLTLTGAMNYTGDVAIVSGTLSLSQAGLADASSVWIGVTNGASAVLDLAHGLTDRVGKLYIDGVLMPDGSYGSSASTATYRDDSAFRGTGALVVQGGPCPPDLSTRTDGYTVATFSIVGTGTWNVPVGVTNLEVLVVGGGGGTWNDGFNSGSGAGGMYYSASYPVSAGALSITVGDGAQQGIGGASRLGAALIAYGGAPGNGYTDGGDQGGYSLNGGATTNAGRAGMHYSPMDGNWCSGGGAGHAGYKGDTQLGGAGVSCAILGSTNYYAGGGGAPSSYGSSGGTGYNLGGGGAGPENSFAERSFSGLPNTGGGGGGGWGGGGGSGGSGIIIVAYKSAAAATTTALASSVNPSTSGQSVVFTATVCTNGVPAPAASGNYVFVLDGANAATQTIAVGSAAFTNSTLTLGTHTVQATYSGDASYESSTASLVQTNLPSSAGSIWTNTVSGRWSDGFNWLGGTAATGSTATAFFTTTNPVTVAVDVTPWTIQNLTFSNSAWVITNGTLNLGDASHSATVTVGSAASSTATVYSAVNAAGTLSKSGAGALSLNGATAAGSLLVGYRADSGSVIVGSSGSLSVGSGGAQYLLVGTAYNGTSGSGILDASAASSVLVNVGNLYVGTCVLNNPTGSGTSGSGATGTGLLKLGTNSTVVAAAKIVIGGADVDANTGVAGGQSGTVTTAGNGVTTVITPQMVVGSGKGNTATFALGQGAVLNLGDDTNRTALVLGRRESTDPNIYNGRTVVGAMDLGGGTARLYLSGLRLSYNNDGINGGYLNGTLTMGASGSNHLDIKGTNNPVRIAFATGAAANFPAGTMSGTLTVNQLDATSRIESTDNSTAIVVGAKPAGAAAAVAGTLNLNGGSLTITTAGTGISGGAGTSSLHLSGGMTLLTGASSTNWISGLTTATLTNNVTFNTSSYDLAVPQAFSGSGSLTKAGAGVLSLSGTNTYSGGTTCSQGVLDVSGAGTFGGGDVTVAAGTLRLDTGTGDAIEDSRRLTVGAGATVELVSNETVNELMLDGFLAKRGTWGAAGSGASHPDIHFTGTGILTVKTGMPSAMVLLVK